MSRIGGRTQHYYTTEATVENLWSKTISSAEFSLYLFDKDKTRIGEGLLLVNNVGPHQVVKFQTGVEADGTPVSMTLSPHNLPQELQAFAGPAPPPPPVSLTVNSVPQGASLKIDGQPSGTTPSVVRLSRGKHTLEFEKPGFTPGTFPLEIGPNDADGGSVNFDMGASAHDTIELRDGSVLVGDLESLSATEALVSIGGTLQHVKRNSIKQILLTERDMPK
ncbi:MAG TPA: PEGA domain-containing protein [Candidatus Angelobacter sp.]|nr:PEGA domain-containing protein [Candidatus Angelobacter sp.]